MMSRNCCLRFELSLSSATGKYKSAGIPLQSVEEAHSLSPLYVRDGPHIHSVVSSLIVCDFYGGKTKHVTVTGKTDHFVIISDFEILVPR